MAKKRILVVEDEAVVARDIEQTLTRLGFEVVGTAQFANEAVAKGKASILLIDDCDAKHASINRRWSFPNSSRREMFSC